MTGRRAAAALATVAGLILTTVAAPMAAGAPGQEADPTLVLRSATTALEAGATLHLEVEVGDAPAGATFQVTAYDRINTSTPDGGRQRLTDSIAGEPRALRNGRKLQTTPPVPPDGIVTFDLNDTNTNRLLRGGRLGLYPLRIALMSDRGRELTYLVTHFVELPDPTKVPPLRVAPIVPLTSAPTLQPDGSRVVAPETRRRVVDTAGMLTRRPAVPVTLEVSPELVTTLAGEPGPDPDVLAALQSVLTANRELLAGPYISLTPADWLRAGLGNEMMAEYDLGTSELSRLGPVVDSSLLVGGDDTNHGVATFLSAFRGTRQLIVPFTALGPEPDDLPPPGVIQVAGLPGGRSMQALVIDPLLSGLNGGTGNGDPVLDANRLVAALSLLALANDGDDVVALPLSDQTSLEMLDTVLAALEPDPTRPGANRLLRAVTAKTAFEPPAGQAPTASPPAPTEVRLVDGLQSPTDELTALAQRVQDSLPKVEEYRFMAPGDQVVATELTQHVLVSGSSALTPDQQRAHAAAIDSTIAARTALVVPPPSQNIRLTARDGIVPLVVLNNTGTDIQITVLLQSDRLQFPDVADGSLELSVPKDQVKFRYDLRVNALTSGSTPLKITVTSPSGLFVLGTSRVTVRSYAVSWMGKILLITSGLFLLLWWGSHIYRERRGPKNPHGSGNPGSEPLPAPGQGPVGEPVSTDPACEARRLMGHRSPSTNLPRS